MNFVKKISLSHSVDCLILNLCSLFNSLSGYIYPLFPVTFCVGPAPGTDRYIDLPEEDPVGIFRVKFRNVIVGVYRSYY